MPSALYSHSRLSCFENCQFQYKLKYVDRVQAPLGTTIEAFVGSRVHDALEWLYRLARDGRVATRGELADKYQELWDAKWKDDIRVIKHELAVWHYRSNGQKWVEQYWDRYQPFDRGITIDLGFAALDLPGPPTLRGEKSGKSSRKGSPGTVPPGSAGWVLPRGAAQGPGGRPPAGAGGPGPPSRMHRRHRTVTTRGSCGG